MPLITKQTILLLCKNDQTWNTARAALTKGIPNVSHSRTSEISKLIDACKEKKPTFLMIERNAFAPDKLAVAIQRLRDSVETANCPIVFLMTSPTDLQSIAMATEYGVKGIISLSELQESISSLAQNIFNELARPDTMQSFLSKIRKARAMNVTGELDMAVLDFHAMYPKDINAQVEYANYCVRYGDWKKAKSIVSSINTEENKNPRILSMKARLLLKEKRYEEAASVIGQAQLMSPNNAPRLALLGDVYWAKGNKAEAREKYQGALAVSENCRDAKRSLAQLNISEGLVNDALTILRDSSTEEEMGSFFNDLAIVAVHEGRNADAHALYGSALSVLKKAKLRARIHFNIGIAYYKASDAVAAGAEFLLAQKDDPAFERANAACALFATSSKSKSEPIWAPEDMPAEVPLGDLDEDPSTQEILSGGVRQDVHKSELSALAQFGTGTATGNGGGSGTGKRKPK